MTTQYELNRSHKNHYAKCTSCERATAHGSGYCEPCRTIVCRDCRVTQVKKVMGARYCDACEKKRRTERRGL